MSTRLHRAKAAMAMLAAGAAIVATACSLFVPKVRAPTLSIVGIDLGRSDFFQQRLKVHVRVENPNDRELPVRSVSYTLDIAGEEAAEGASSASFIVPPLGDAQFDMDVTANLAGTVLKLLLARGDGSAAGSVAYHIRGKVELSQGIWRSIPFDERGSFSLR
ncbi:MAG TPA: LEA type 2 family protein [Steroidobacteraceae bacterium]|nr:LEA type 2 family protein [Steroidobacteraceae bacterium]